MTEQPEKKILIDEDWKTQVQREKELLKEEEAKRDETQAAAPTAADVATDAKHGEAAENNQANLGDSSAPPASFEYLVSGMATQAVAAMGQIPDTNGQPYPVRLDYAKHYIDLLGVIEAKTQGNLSEAEQKFLQSTLHQLRMIFVAVKK
jgi:Domain of unknown function (DUF1844)